MKIAIIGAGFTGLSAAYQLVKKGHDVTVFEKDQNPGGLALGFKQKDWKWSLEKYYHHWFTNDIYALRIAKELNFPYYISRPKTSIYRKEGSYQLDSPTKLLSFPLLSIKDRFRMAAVLGLIKYNPFWQPFEKIEISKFLPKYLGQKAYSLIWEPQLQNKFGKYSNFISLAWFWARITKRTSSLAYPESGFLAFAQRINEAIQQLGGKIFFDTPINRIKKTLNGKYRIVLEKNTETIDFDAVIVTLPSHIFLNMIKDFPKQYQENLNKLQYLGTINLVIRLKKQFLEDNTYWLSICEKTSPVMAIVEHTNFIDKKYYNNEHIVYLGNYIDQNSPYLAMTKQDLLQTYHPILNKIHPGYSNEIIDTHLFKTPFAQPIIPTNYSQIMPPFETPHKNIFLANMQQVYPWDRGTNYAIELGEKVSLLIDK